MHLSSLFFPTYNIIRKEEEHAEFTQAYNEKQQFIRVSGDSLTLDNCNVIYAGLCSSICGRF